MNDAMLKVVAKVIAEKNDETRKFFSALTKALEDRFARESTSLHFADQQQLETLEARAAELSALNDNTLELVSDRLDTLDSQLAAMDTEQKGFETFAEAMRDQLTQTLHHTDKNLALVWESIKAWESKSEAVRDELVQTILETEQKHLDLVQGLAEQLKDDWNIKAWSPGIYRLGCRVKHNMGDQYMALKDTTEEPSPMANDWAHIQSGLRFKGLYKEDQTYSYGDILVKDGATWLQGDDRLHLLAMRGEQGKRGPIGLQGLAGLSEIEIKSIMAAKLEEHTELVIELASEASHGEFISKKALNEILVESDSFENFKRRLLA